MAEATGRSLAEVHSSVPVPGIGGWLRRFLAFAGPGYLVSVGYMDPGNWATERDTEEQVIGSWAT